MAIEDIFSRLRKENAKIEAELMNELIVSVPTDNIVVIEHDNEELVIPLKKIGNRFVIDMGT